MDDFDARSAVQADLSANQAGTGRELFEIFRSQVGHAADGAAVVI